MNSEAVEKAVKSFKQSVSRLAAGTDNPEFFQALTQPLEREALALESRFTLSQSDDKKRYGEGNIDFPEDLLVAAQKVEQAFSKNAIAAAGARFNHAVLSDQDIRNMRDVLGSFEALCQAALPSDSQTLRQVSRLTERFKRDMPLSTDSQQAGRLC